MVQPLSLRVPREKRGSEGVLCRQLFTHVALHRSPSLVLTPYSAHGFTPGP
jgi:hypothetical protein